MSGSVDVAELMEATRDILGGVCVFFAGCILLRLLKLQKQVVLLAGIFWCARFIFYYLPGSCSI